MGPSARQWPIIWHRVKTWGAALKSEAAKHGRPNNFGITEMAKEHGLTRRDGYYVGNFRLYELWQELGGHEGWGSCPTYENGRFYV